MSELNLQPKKVFYYFEELCKIPHGSRDTKRISDYLVSFAKEHQLEYYQDEMNNVIMIQEASQGYEQAQPIIIQGHMDMVCEKESDCEIDFTKEGLSLFVDGDFLKAKGTTLGGDDGIAVAYALAILDSPEIVHPRLEIVITVDEEIGMLGAEKIDLSMLKGHKLLNIDSDEEGHFLTSCAGGMMVETHIPVSYMSQTGALYEITIAGLQGGHSGSEINKERGNAIILMGRVLHSIFSHMEMGIVQLSGGLKDNAIPRECTAKVLVPIKEKENFCQYLSELQETLAKEYENSDSNISLTTSLEEEEFITEILSYQSLSKVIFYLRNVPNGVRNMSMIMPGLVETSLNQGIMELNHDNFVMIASVRSSVSSRKQDLCDKLELLAEFLGGEISVSGDYPAWEYRSQSSLREDISHVYQTLFQKEPVFEAIHAGLECGILSGKIADLDCVSFGPDNYDIHTPKERLSISSTARVWDLLVEFLKTQNQ